MNSHTVKRMQGALTAYESMEVAAMMRSRAGLVQLSREYKAMVVDTTAGLPAWFRPVATVCIHGIGLLFSILVVPIALVLIPRIFRDVRVANQLRDDAGVIWTDEGPRAAVSFLENIYKQLEASSEKRYELAAYGKVDTELMTSYVAGYLYSYLTQLEDWSGALQVSRSMTTSCSSGFYSSWHIREAKCLRRLGRGAEALEILFRARGQVSVADEANRLLESWRSSHVQDQRTPSPARSSSPRAPRAKAGP